MTEINLSKGKWSYTAVFPGGENVHLKANSQVRAIKALSTLYVFPERWRLYLTKHGQPVEYWDVGSEGEMIIDPIDPTVVVN
jgi:hypothetical protein